MGERSLSASSLNSYPPAYYDRNTPDMGPRHVAGGGHKPGASVGGNSVSKLTARMDRLDISAEGPAYGPKPAGGGGGRGRPHMRVSVQVSRTEKDTSHITREVLLSHCCRSSHASPRAVIWLCVCRAGTADPAGTRPKGTNPAMTTKPDTPPATNDKKVQYYHTIKLMIFR